MPQGNPIGKHPQGQSGLKSAIFPLPPGSQRSNIALLFSRFSVSLLTSSPVYVCAIAVSCVQGNAVGRNRPQDMGFSMLTPVNYQGTLASFGALGTQPSRCEQRLTVERQAVLCPRFSAGLSGLSTRFPGIDLRGCRASHSGSAPAGRSAIASTGTPDMADFALAGSRRRRCSN